MFSMFNRPFLINKTHFAFLNSFVSLSCCGFFKVQWECDQGHGFKQFPDSTAIEMAYANDKSKATITLEGQEVTILFTEMKASVKDKQYPVYRRSLGR